MLGTLLLATALNFTCVDGIYPHLAMFNGEGECGTGAVVPWAGSLWRNGTAAAAYWLWRSLH